MTSSRAELIRQYLIRAAIAAVGWGAMTGAVGCDKSEPTTPPEHARRVSDDASSTGSKPSQAGPAIIHKDGPPPEAGAVLARSSDIEVTLADFEQSMRQSMLAAPDGQLEPSKRRLASPSLQIGVVRTLLASKIIAHEARRRGITVSHADKVAALESTSGLAKFAPILADQGDQKEGAHPLERRGLTVDDLDAVGADIARRNKLRAAIIADITDQQVWKAYQRRGNRVRLFLASLRNTPTMEEISAFVDGHHDRIQRYFERHTKSYRTPAMVRLTVLEPPPSASPSKANAVDTASLKQAAERLEGGDQPATVASDLGLRVDDAQLVRSENPAAFGADEGQSGFEISGPRGSYAWIKRGMRPSEPAELTAAVGREIAAELLRGDGPVASKARRIRRAISKMNGLPTNPPDAAIDRLKDQFEADGLAVHQIESFSRTGRGYIPGVGLAEEVEDRAFSLPPNHPVADEPILSRGKVWAVRVMDHQHVSRDSFEGRQEALRTKYIERNKDRLLDQFLTNFRRKHPPRINLDPLRIKYGTLQKR